MMGFEIVEVAKMLAEPDVGVGWRCEGLVADGTLTLLAGVAGDGKTFLAHGLAAAVARGEESFAGIPCTPGKALVVDAEMGKRQTIKRWKVQGIGPEVSLIDASNFSLANDEDFAALADYIVDEGFNYVVLDSLRRLTPGRAENSSDDMAPVVGKVANFAHQSNAAIILIHHKGKSYKDSSAPAYRGSTAIGDQVDTVFNLSREEKLLGKGGRRLACVEKMRYAPEPEDRFIRFAPELGGFVEADAPESDVQLAHKIAEAAPQPSKHKLAQAVGKQSGNARFIRLCNELENGGMTLIGPSSDSTKEW